MAMFDVIKYESDGSTLVYQFPREDFNTKSKLIVQQSQEAVFYSRGKLADHFVEPGTYTLETKNIPILCKLVNLPFGKQSPFNAKVYFIDKTERLNNKWGIQDIPFIEPEYKLPMSIGLSGEYAFKISDAKLFISKLLGTIAQFDSEQLHNLIEEIVAQRITASMTNYLKENKYDLFTIETELNNISDILKNSIENEFYNYGFEITQFIIFSIAKHEETQEYQTYYEFRTQAAEAKIKLNRELSAAQIDADAQLAKQQKQNAVELQDYDLLIQKRQELVNLELEAKRGEIEALKIKQQMLAEAEGLAVQGVSKAQMEAYEVAKLTAQNEGSGNFVSTGMGMGMGIVTMGAAASAVGGLYNDALSQVTNTFNTQQPDQQEQNDFSASAMIFGENTGLGSTPQEIPADDAKAKRRSRLLELKELLDDGIIDEGEFKAKKAEILSQI